MKFDDATVERIRADMSHAPVGGEIHGCIVAVLNALQPEDMVRALEGVVEGAVWADVAKAWERVGMIRAAEICDTRGATYRQHGKHTAVQLAVTEECAAAIRAEANK